MASDLLKKKFYQWWVSVLLIATIIFWFYYLGIVSKIYKIDETMLTSVIMIIFVVFNAVLGWIAYRLDDPTYTNRAKLIKAADNCWFMSEQMLALGMLGTVIGLINMLNTGLVSSEIQNIENLQGMIMGMWKHMGLALYTNAVGLATSIVFKKQIQFIVGDVEHETQKV